jgi:hypothetical protein
MINLEPTIQLLHDKRRELLEQLNAIDRAIQALAFVDASLSTRTPPAAGPTQDEPVVGAPVAVVVIPPKRVLTDSQKKALLEGRRKAREAKLRRSQGLEPGRPAISLPPDPLPRLVKRSNVPEVTLAAVDETVVG